MCSSWKERRACQLPAVNRIPLEMTAHNVLLQSLGDDVSVQICRVETKVLGCVWKRNDTLR